VSVKPGYPLMQGGKFWYRRAAPLQKTSVIAEIDNGSQANVENLSSDEADSGG
jgi:hypothetical protein